MIILYGCQNVILKFCLELIAQIVGIKERYLIFYADNGMKGLWRTLFGFICSFVYCCIYY